MSKGITVIKIKRTTLCALCVWLAWETASSFGSSVPPAVMFFTNQASAQEQLVDRKVFNLQKFIVEKENVMIINELSTTALTPDQVITTRSGAEYYRTNPDQPPQTIAGSALGNEYLEIFWNNETSAWIEFEKLGNRPGFIDRKWLYPDQDIIAYVRAYENDRVILRDENRKILGPLTPHRLVTVKKLDASRRYYYVHLEQPLLIDDKTYTEGQVYYKSLYLKQNATPPASNPSYVGDARTVSSQPSDIFENIPEGPEEIRRLHIEIKKILARYVQLVDQISIHYMTLYGKTDISPVFRVFQLKDITGNPLTDATLVLHFLPNASSTIPLKDSEAALESEIERKVRDLYPSIATVQFMVE